MIETDNVYDIQQYIMSTHGVFLKVILALSCCSISYLVAQHLLTLIIPCCQYRCTMTCKVMPEHQFQYNGCIVANDYHNSLCYQIVS